MKGTGKILNGQLRLEPKFNKLLLDNEEAEVDIEIIVLNKPEHYLYKFIFGYLYVDMAKFMATSVDDIHSDMKEVFAKDFVEEWIDVPRRHRKKCERYERVHDNGSVIRWYIKSLSSMTHEEIKDYLQRVEYHYYNFLGGNEDAGVKAGFKLRVKGMMDEKQLKKHLKESI